MLVEYKLKSYESLLEQAYTSFSGDIFKKWNVFSSLHVKNNYPVHC